LHTFNTYFNVPIVSLNDVENLQYVPRGVPYMLHVDVLFICYLFCNYVYSHV